MDEMSVQNESVAAPVAEMTPEEKRKAAARERTRRWRERHPEYYKQHDPSANIKTEAVINETKKFWEEEEKLHEWRTKEFSKDYADLCFAETQHGILLLECYAYATRPSSIRTFDGIVKTDDDFAETFGFVELFAKDHRARRDKLFAQGEVAVDGSRYLRTKSFFPCAPVTESVLLPMMKGVKNPKEEDGTGVILRRARSTQWSLLIQNGELQPYLDTCRQYLAEHNLPTAQEMWPARFEKKPV